MYIHCIYIYIYICFFGGVQNQGFVFFAVNNSRYNLGGWTRVSGAQMGPRPGPNWEPP